MAEPDQDNFLLAAILLLLAQQASESDPKFADSILRLVRQHPSFRQSGLFDFLSHELFFRRKPFDGLRRKDEARQVAALAISDFRKEFTGRLEKQLHDISDQIQKTSHIQDHLSAKFSQLEATNLQSDSTLHDLIWALTTGADLTRARTIKYVPVRVYFGDPAPKEDEQDKIISLIGRMLRPVGLFQLYGLSPEKGSWWQRLVFRTAELLTQREVQERLGTIEDALKIAYLDKPQAEANKIQASAAADLINSLKDTPNASIQVGTLMLVKVTHADGKCALAANTLSNKQLQAIEENYEILKNPQAAFALLESPNEEDKK